MVIDQKDAAGLTEEHLRVQDVAAVEDARDQRKQSIHKGLVAIGEVAIVSRTMDGEYAEAVTLNLQPPAEDVKDRGD